MMEMAELAPGYEISRVIRGGWQLAGGHGAVDRQSALEDLLASFNAGIATFDCADIYTGVEEMMGALRAAVLQQQGQAASSRLKVHTKFVPDLDILPNISRDYVTGVIDRSLHRLGMERLDNVQFHWWDYAIPGYLETAAWLVELQKAGKINLLGGTNFDTPHLEALVAAGVQMTSLQVQYSVLDARPSHKMAAACKKLGVSLLCYGSVAGGFLSEKWLGAAEPAQPMENRSLIKYKLIIDDFGGWALFQELLSVLQKVGRRHDVGISTVAGRYILDQDQVAAIIVGARNRSHVDENAKTAGLRLTVQDRQEIGQLLEKRQGPTGDVYTLERDRTGRHGSIMKYNLNK